jgi:hypothetical protein
MSDFFRQSNKDQDLLAWVLVHWIKASMLHSSLVILTCSQKQNV